MQYAGAAGDLAASIFVPAHKAGCAIDVVITGLDGMQG